MIVCLHHFNESFNMTPLHIAVENNHIDIVRLLLSNNKVNINFICYVSNKIC